MKTDERMLQVLREIARITRAGDYPPAVRELADALSISQSTTHYWLRLLRDEGYVTWQPGQSRTLTITLKGRMHLPRLPGYTNWVSLKPGERVLLARALQVAFGASPHVSLTTERFSDAALETVFALLLHGLDDEPG